MNDANIKQGITPFNKVMWCELAEKELKGKALEELLWKTEDGFEIDPIYFAPHKEHWKLNGPRRGVHRTDQERSICRSFDATLPDLNRELLNALENGANAVEIRHRSNAGSKANACFDDWKALDIYRADFIKHFNRYGVASKVINNTVKITDIARSIQTTRLFLTFRAKA